MIKFIKIIFLTICNFIAVTFFPQDLQLSFSEHVPYESNYKAIRCINYNSKHLLFQSKQKNQNIAILRSISLMKILKFKINSTLKLIMKSWFVRLLFDNIVLFTTLNNGVETVLRSRILDISSKFLVLKIFFQSPTSQVILLFSNLQMKPLKIL